MGGAEGKSEIEAIPNKYKDTLDNLIDSSDIKSPDRPNSPDRPALIDKGSRNTPKSRSGSSTLSDEDCFNENVLVMSLESIPKI